MSNFFRRRALSALISAQTIVPPPAPPGVTIGDLGYLGVNVAGSTDFTFGYLHSNALLDSRGFTALSTGSTPAALDANGLPTGTSTLCFTTSPGVGKPGPLPAGSYFLNVQSTGHATTASVSSSYVTMGAGVVQGDGVTIRYPVTVGTSLDGSTASFNFTGPLTAFPDLARNGATSSSGQPLFCDDALAYYSQFYVLRLMDFLNPNLRTDTSWATRPGNWLLRAYGGTYSWEKMVAFINAVQTYPGSKLKNVLINIPINADTSYAGNLSAYLNTLGLTSSVQVYVQRANEHWNTGQAAYGPLLNLGVAELNYVANYGVTTPTITSIVTDGTKATFTLANPVSTYFSGDSAPCVVVGGAFGFTVGTKAAPATASVAGPNTITVLTTATWNSTANGGSGGFVGIVFNLASSLVADGLMPDVFHAGAKYWVRSTYQDQQAWVVNRPQDRFFLDMGISNGSGNAGGGTSIPIEMRYASYLGGGMPTWLYGVAIAPYVQSTSASTTLTALFTELNGLITSRLDGQVRSYRYWANLMGLHLMAYEMGPDMQGTPSLVVSAMTDARMGTVQASLLSMWYSNGGEHVAAFTGTPGAFINGAQGGWPIAQSYTDTTSPKLVATLAYFANSITLANVYGSPGTLDIPSHYEVGAGAILNGMFGWFSPGNYVDVMAAIPTAGSYTLTLNGTSKNSNVVTFNLDPTYTSNGTNIGNSTLIATGGGWNVDSAAAAVPVSNPITLTMTAGIHTLRLFPTAVSTGGAALKSITIISH